MRVIEQAIATLDAAPTPAERPRQSELTIYMLYGSMQARGGTDERVPSDLEATVRQLRNLFPYQSYRLIDTLVLRVSNGVYANDSGPLPGGLGAYSVRARLVINPGPPPRSVQFNDLSVQFTFARGVTNGATNLSVSLEAREGQKTVVGKSNVTGTDDAVILVVTPRVIE